MKKFLLLAVFIGTIVNIQAQILPCDMVVLTTIDNACYGGTGSGTVLVETGSGTLNYPLTVTLYDYSGNIAYTSTILTGSGTGATGSGAIFSIYNLNPDDYTLVVMDDTPCYDSSYVSVIEYDEIIITATIQDEINGNDGSVLAAVSGGTAPYFYSWSNGATTSDIIAISGGTYTLAVTDANDCSGFISVAVQSYVGINEQENEIDIILYPNPAKEFVTIKYELASNAEDIQIMIYDIRGQVALSQSINEQQSSGSIKMDVSRLSPGTYTYSFVFSKEGSKHNETGRILIVR